MLHLRVETHQTRVIHALDVANTLPPDAPDSARSDLIEQACHIAAAVAPHVVAIKLNYPLVLAIGLEIAHQIKLVVPDLPLIADFKVADIDNTNSWIARHTFAAGFDAVIVQGFIGEDAIQAVLDEAKKVGDRGVILVVDMSHPGATQFIHPQTWIIPNNSMNNKIQVKIHSTLQYPPLWEEGYYLTWTYWQGSEVRSYTDRH